MIETKLPRNSESGALPDRCHSQKLSDDGASEDQKTSSSLLVGSLLILMIASLGMSGCGSSGEHLRLRFARSNESLRIEVDSVKSAGWSPIRDSVVVECTECNDGEDHGSYTFQTSKAIDLDLSGSSKLNVKVYKGGAIDTTYQLDASLLKESRDVTGARRVAKREPATARSRTNGTGDNEDASTGDVSQRRQLTHSPTTIRVVAREGVAVYRDKTKREVLRILPLGSVIPYLAREGDVYSVVLEEGEGFVDAEAVQIVK